MEHLAIDPKMATAHFLAGNGFVALVTVMVIVLILWILKKLLVN